MGADKIPSSFQSSEAAQGELSTDLLHEEKKKGGNIVTVALLGSLDDFTVYVIMATSGVYTWYELVIGTFGGCLVLALIVAIFTESDTISSLLEKVPVWMILGCLGLYVLSS